MTNPTKLKLAETVTASQYNYTGFSNILRSSRGSSVGRAGSRIAFQVAGSSPALGYILKIKDDLFDHNFKHVIEI